VTSPVPDFHVAPPGETAGDSARTEEGRTEEGRTEEGRTEECLRLLRAAARLMLEYNVRASVLVAQINRLSAALGTTVRTSVAYREVALWFDDGRCFHVQAPEYRLNVFVSSGVLRLVDQVCAGTIRPRDALRETAALERSHGCHGRWELAALFGLAAAALARILHADAGAMAVGGVASALGLLARRELGRRHAPLFSLPFAAALIGGLIAGVAIRFGWTQTAGLCLLVPALMLVPGPHLINGISDVFENYIQTGLCRLALAAGVLLSAALGTFAGGWLVIGLRDVGGAPDAAPLTLWTDVLLAGLAACGFGAFYNSPWRVLWISIVCGMIGHGVRFLCLGQGAGLPASTLLACAAVGLLTNLATRPLRLPFSSVAFAAAVPMMPGSLIYRSLAGAVRLSMSGQGADPLDATRAVVSLLQALLTIGAMAAGLAVGALLASGALGLTARPPRRGKLSAAPD